MGVISNAGVSVSLDGATASATVTWSTDVSSDSTVTYGAGGVQLGAERNPGFVNQHSVTISRLQAGTEFYAILASSDDRGNPLSCDIVSPGANCTLTFKTPAASGPATSLTVSGNPMNISKGQSSQLTIAARSDSGAASGRSVRFDIHNGNDRGTFSPNPATTGADGKALVSFTAAKNGKAQIQVLVDTQSEGIDIMVN